MAHAIARGKPDKLEEMLKEAFLVASEHVDHEEAMQQAWWKAQD